MPGMSSWFYRFSGSLCLAGLLHRLGSQRTPVFYPLPIDFASRRLAVVDERVILLMAEEMNPQESVI